ncbi:MAG: hypothetical protein KGI59_01060 [Patescibacteria group bacterium]|nr:hypothetical protein [Patescibacteria group bacterium]
MLTINRTVAIIKPKRPYIKWANSLPDADREYTDEVFQKDQRVLLIPEHDTPKEDRAYINTIWREIFDEELLGWSLNRSWWPKERTQKMFWQWFDVEFHSMVVDMCDTPIETEEL